MTNRKRSIVNMVSAAIGQLLAMAIGFLLPRLFITNFGSEVNGLINSANEILVYLALFEAGVGAVTLHALYGPVARQGWGEINGILSATNVYYKKAGTLYVIVLAAVAFIYPFIIAVELPHLTVSLVVFFVGLPQVVSFYVQAKYILLLKADGRNYAITNMTSFVIVVSGLAKVTLLMLGVEVLPVIIAQSGIMLIQAVVLSRYVKRKYPELSVRAVPNYKSISQKNYMLIHQISGLVFQSTDVIILTMVLGLKYVSVYSVYKLVMSQIRNIFYIFQNSVDFILGQTYQTDKKKFIRRIDQFESWFSALAFSLYSVVYFLLYGFVQMYTEGITDAIYADRVLVLLFVLIELLIVMRTPMLQTINYAGYFKETLPQSLIETIINLLVSLVAVYLLGIYGVLIGTVAALLYRTNADIVISNTKLMNRSPVHTYLIHLINIAIFILVQLLFSAIFPQITGWGDLIMTGILAGTISVPLFIVVQTLVWRNNRSTFLYYFKNGRATLKKVFNKERE